MAEENTVCFTVLVIDSGFTVTDKASNIEKKYTEYRSVCLPYAGPFRRIICRGPSARETEWKRSIEDFVDGHGKEFMLDPKILVKRDPDDDNVFFCYVNDRCEQIEDTEVVVDGNVCEPLWNALLGRERSESEVSKSRRLVMDERRRYFKHRAMRDVETGLNMAKRGLKRLGAFSDDDETEEQQSRKKRRGVEESSEDEESTSEEEGDEESTSEEGDEETSEEEEESTCEAEDENGMEDYIEGENEQDEEGIRLVDVINDYKDL